MTQRIRLVLADDESLTRGAVGALLGLESDLVIVGEAAPATKRSRACSATTRTSRCWTSRCRVATARRWHSGSPRTSPAPAASS